MTNDLGSIVPEVETAVKELGLVLFHGKSRIASDLIFIEWDSERRPDYREFLAVANSCGVKLVCLHDYKFEAQELEEALAAVKDGDLSTQERRGIEKQLNALQMYVGFTCGLELSFDYQDNVYYFHLRTPWRTEFIQIMTTLDEQLFDTELDERDEPMGGSFFSRN